MVPRPGPATRRQLLLAAGGTAATLAFGSEALAATAPVKPDPPGPRVVRLLSIELLVLFAYEQVSARGGLDPAAQGLVDELRLHEHAHVEALLPELARFGAAAPPAPTSIADADRRLARRGVAGRLAQLRGPRDAIRLLLDVERVVTGAYFVALTKVSDRALIDLCARIMAAEAQHEALIGQLLYHGNIQKSVPYGLVQGKQ